VALDLTVSDLAFDNLRTLGREGFRMVGIGTRVRDFTGARAPLTVEVASNLAAEILIELLTFSSPEAKDTLEVGPAWFEEVRSKASRDLLAAFERIGGFTPWGILSGFAFVPTLVASVAHLIERLEALPPAEMWSTLLGYHLPEIRSRVDADAYRKAAGGDAEARGSLLAAIRAIEKDFADEVASFLDLSVEEATSLVIEIIRRWHQEIFQPKEKEVGGLLTRDAEAKRNRVGAQSIEQLVEAATNGLQFRSEPWMRRLLLVPHMAMRPWNVMSAHDDLAIIFYPVADETLGTDAAAPPARLVRLHKALGDEKRLRILKVLASGPATLQELASAVGLAKSSTHHHMVILRSAGLVLVGVFDDNTRYSLRRDFLPEAATLLGEFLEAGAR
jgi:DNA-binding transcriptional ArsR family regulator